MLFPLLLSAAGLILAYLPVLARWSDLPVAVPFLFLGAGVIWGAWVVRGRRTKRNVALFSGQVLILGVQAIWWFQLSSYAQPEGAPMPGNSAPSIRATRVRDGAPFELAAQRGHPVLLVFFRGPW
ncbi:MAG: hypothetical protein ACYTGV_06030 [Planctomycetota bacterium]